MTKEEFESELKSLDFYFEREEEYHRGVFINDHYRLISLSTMSEYEVSLVVFTDRYTARIVWWLDNSHKLTKSYYMNKEVKDSRFAVSLISSFIQYCVEIYRIDIDNYKITVN